MIEFLGTQGYRKVDDNDEQDYDGSGIIGKLWNGLRRYVRG